MNITTTVVRTILNYKNYNVWSSQMKTYLLAEDLWDIIDEGTDEEKAQSKAWKKKDAKVLYAIQNSCRDDTYELIKDETTAKGAWYTLSEELKKQEEEELKKQEEEELKKQDEKDKRSVGEAYPTRILIDDDTKSQLSMEEGRTEGPDDVQQTFVKYVESKDWINAITILRQHPEAASARVSLDYGTALHYAIRNKCRVFFIGELVELMKDGHLETTDRTGSTALHYAIRNRCSVRIIRRLVELMATEHLAIRANLEYTALYYTIKYFPESVEVAECMVKKNPNLLTILPRGDEKPLVVLAQGNAKGERMACYLYSRVPSKTIKVIDAAQLISDGFRLQRFDIAWDLIQRYPKLALATNHDGDIPLGTLASNSVSFKSVRRLNLWEELVYHGIRIKPLSLINTDSCINVGEPESGQGDERPLSYQKENQRHRIYSGINRIYQMKLVHEWVQQFLTLMRKVVRKEDMSGYERRRLDESLCVAAEQGHVEYINHFLKYSRYPIFSVRNEKRQSLFQIAAECRHYNVYYIICKLLRKVEKYGSYKRILYDLDYFEGLKEIVEHKDDLGNNMLHTVARITPLSQIDHIQGAILQMQRELQWFKKVESIVDFKDCESVNNDNKTPRKVFTENHKELGKEAEKSMKETATSCTVVGALTVTIMFAVAFTIPGGNDAKARLPKVFTFFIVSDAISLFSSTTSVIMFLGILTSRYSQDDFHKSLPTKMIIGLFTLFLSIATMIIVFSCGLYIILDGKSSLVIPSILLASVPIASFIWMQFPLLKDLSISTFGRKIFDRKQKNLF